MLKSNIRGVKSEGAFSEKVLMVKEAQCAGGLYRASEGISGLGCSA